MRYLFRLGTNFRVSHFMICGILRRQLLTEVPRKSFFIYILGPAISYDYLIFYHLLDFTGVRIAYTTFCITLYGSLLMLRICDLSPSKNIFKGYNSAPRIFLFSYYFDFILSLSLKTITTISFDISHHSNNMPSNILDDLQYTPHGNNTVSKQVRFPF